METKQYNKLSICINVILLILTFIALIYTFKQTEIARVQANLAEKQANIAKEQTTIMMQQTDIAKDNLKTARGSYELAEKIYRESLSKDVYDNSFATVLDYEMLQDILTPIYNGKIIKVKFQNKSSRPQSYLVTVEAKGVMVSQPDSHYMYSDIQLSELPIALEKSEVYQNQFRVFIPKNIRKDATLVIKANGKVIRSAQYKYNNNSKNYHLIK